MKTKFSQKSEFLCMYKQHVWYSFLFFHGQVDNTLLRIICCILFHLALPHPLPRTGRNSEYKWGSTSHQRSQLFLFHRALALGEKQIEKLRAPFLKTKNSDRPKRKTAVFRFRVLFTHEPILSRFSSSVLVLKFIIIGFSVPKLISIYGWKMASSWTA